MLTIACSHCGAKLAVDAKMIGQRVRCAKCSSIIAVPATATPLDAAWPNDQPTQMEPPAADQSTDPVGPQTGTDPASGILFQPVETKPSVSGRKKRRRGRGRRRSKFPWTVVGVLGIAAVGIGLFLIRGGAKPEPFGLKKIADQQLTEGDAIKITVAPTGHYRKLSYSLIDSPKGATIDESGCLHWTPAEEHGGKKFTITVQATAKEPVAAETHTSFQVTVAERNVPPVLQPLADVTAEFGTPIRFQVSAEDPDTPPSQLVYSLEKNAPPDATIDADTGEFRWTPQKEHLDQTFVVTIRVTETGTEELHASQTVTIAVTRPASPMKALLAELRDRNIPVETRLGDDTLPFTGARHVLLFGAERVRVFEYPSDAETTADVDQVSTDGHALFGQPWQNDEELKLYRNDRLIAAYSGINEDIGKHLNAVFGSPFSTVSRQPEMRVDETPELSAFMKTLIGLYEQRDPSLKKTSMLLSLRSYDEVRKAFSEEFERQHEQEIRAAFGDDYDAMMAWFETRTGFKEELYTAFRPPQDDITAGLTLFKQIKDQFPKQLERYGNLAIAVAVAWDKPRPDIYDYAQHQRRTKSTMPDNLLDGIGNFKYLVDAEQYMQGRIRYVPWEFLTLVVNHKTPVSERVWAMQNYVGKRVMFGKCYSEVPYDGEMLATHSQVCRLADKPYTLANLRTFGGVCAMQADFAARVGQSIGVPAAYVWGANRYGGLHAWVMWVELKAVTANSIAFSLESHGRYRGDRYYVGNLRDPHTGQRITDRMLELRLHAAGVNTPAKRHAQRVMSVYDELAKQMDLDLNGRLSFLSQAIHLNPWSEPAWTALSRIPGTVEEPFNKPQLKQMAQALSQLFITFAPFPDFTLTIFDDLTSFVPDPDERIKYYYRLLDVYSNAKRPDLAFAGLLKLSDLLVEAGRANEAVLALATAIKKYAEEGQYVPKMLDKLEELHASLNGSDESLIKFYTEFLPRIPPARDNEPSEYCIKMFERGIALFQASGQTQLAQAYGKQLQLIQAGPR